MWFLYICDRRGQLYTGITTDLDHRIKQHQAKLLYSEQYSDKHSAANRERQIKGWRRDKKLALIEGSKVSLSWAKPKGVRAGEPISKGPIERLGLFTLRGRRALLEMHPPEHFHLHLLSSGALACRIKKIKRFYFLPTVVLVTGLLDQNAATVSYWITGCK